VNYGSFLCFSIAQAWLNTQNEIHIDLFDRLSEQEQQTYQSYINHAEGKQYALRQLL